MTRAELLDLPAVTNLLTLAKAFGISEPTVRERHRRGEFEAMGIRVLRLGACYRVITADVLRVLGVLPDPGLAGPEAGPTAAGQDGSRGRELPDGERTAPRGR